MTAQDLRFLGFAGWVDLARYIKRNDLEKFEAIRLPKHALTIDPAAMPVPPLSLSDEDCWVLSIEEIKSNAFDEIFSALPLAVSIGVVVDAIEEKTPGSEAHVISFLKKLPTRDL